MLSLSWAALLPLLLTLFLTLTTSLPLPPPSARPPPPIALLHMYDSISFFQRLGTLTGENKARYAARHGYHFVQSTPRHTSGILREAPCQGSPPGNEGKCWTERDGFDIDHSRAPTFGKVKLALAACEGRDGGWLLWSDADALVVNQSVRLESIIDDGYDIMLAYDWLMLNAGVLLLKCSPWTTKFLTHVYTARKFDTARTLDQGSIQEHLDNLTAIERDAHVKVVPKHAINVYVEEYRPGDFLLHMAGKLYEASEPGLYAIASQFDVLSMVEDVEDIAAFFRSRALLNYYSGTCKVKAGHRQAECRPEDPRRIFLNETLGSMSTPNRYRHVGIRYYWLGAWKDKYDVPGWNDKKKELAVPPMPPKGMKMPPVPVALLHQDKVGTDQQVTKTHDARDGAEDMNAREEDKTRLDAPEVEHEADLQPVAKKLPVKQGERKGVFPAGANEEGEGEEDGQESGSWSICGRVLLFGLCAGGISGVILGLKKRRQRLTKIQ